MRKFKYVYACDYMPVHLRAYAPASLPSEISHAKFTSIECKMVVFFLCLQFSLLGDLTTPNDNFNSMH